MSFLEQDTVYVISGLQTAQGYNYPAETFRGVRFPLVWEGQQMLTVLLKFGNVFDYGNASYMPSSWWNSERALWQWTGDSLRNWDFVSKRWLYIQSYSLQLTESPSSAAELLISTGSNGKVLIQDTATLLFLDWGSTFDPAPSNSQRSRFGFGWFLVPFTNNDAWRFHPLPLSENPIICDPAGAGGGSTLRPPQVVRFGPTNSSLRLIPQGTNLTGSMFISPKPDEYVTLEAFYEVVSIGLVLSLRADGRGLVWESQSFVNEANQPEARQVLRYSEEKQQVYFQPHSLSTTRYVLHTNQSAADYDPSQRVAIQVSLAVCDRLDPTLPAGGCPEVLRPVPYQDYSRLKLLRWGEGYPESNTYSIQDTITGQCVSVEDFTLVPCGYVWLSRFWNRATWPQTPIWSSEFTKVQLYGVPRFPLDLDSYPASCNSTQPNPTPSEGSRAGCCRGEYRKIVITRSFTVGAPAGTISVTTYTVSGMIALSSNVAGSLVTQSVITEFDNAWVSCKNRKGEVRYLRVLEGYTIPVNEPETGFNWVGRVAPPIDLIRLPEFGSGFGNDSTGGEGGLVQLELKNDGAVCGTDWCPFGAGCNGYNDGIRTLTSYCGTADLRGLPRYKTEARCKLWCAQDPGLNFSRCYSISAPEFCRENPQSPSCMCLQFETTPAFLRIKSLFQALPGYGDAGLVIPDPFCWAEPCTIGRDAETGPVVTSQQLLTPCGSNTLTFCNAVVEVIRTTGSVVIDRLTFLQVCGSTHDWPEDGGGGGDGIDIVWIKEHPWQFVGLLLACLALVVGIGLLADAIVRVKGRR